MAPSAESVWSILISAFSNRRPQRAPVQRQVGVVDPDIRFFK
jgi:hypothetical protein